MWTTILGIGSLLSEESSRTTFPDLRNFRLGRVPNYRRIFAHSPAVFYKRGIANPETKELSSLSAEYVREGFPGFVCTVFEVPSAIMMEGGIPGVAYREREEEFDIQRVRFLETNGQESEGILCVKWSDEEYIRYWGRERFEEKYTRRGIPTIWSWSEDSGLRPCRKYFQLCLAAAERMGEDCYTSFLDETFLVDRKTTIRQYLEEHPGISKESE